LWRANFSLKPRRACPTKQGRDLNLPDFSWPSAIRSRRAEQACSVAPQQPVVYRLLAVIHLQQQDYPALLDNLDAYIRLDPDSPAGQRAKQLRADTLQHLSGSQAAVSVTSH